MTSKQAIDIFKEKYPHKKPIGYWIDGENVILNTSPSLGLGYSTSPSLGLGYSEVCQYIVFADGKIQPTNPVRSEVILNTPMKRIR